MSLPILASIPQRAAPAALLGGILLAGTAAAADGGSPLDVRIVGALLDDDYRYDASGSALGSSLAKSGDAKWEDAWRAGVVAQRPVLGSEVVGFTSGLGLLYTRFTDHGDEDRYEALSAQLRLGLGVAITDVITIELQPIGGLGAARGRIGDVDSGDPDLYWEYGAELGAYATIDWLQVGIQGGWLRSGVDLRFDDRGEYANLPFDDVELRIRSEGFYVGASLGARF